MSKKFIIVLILVLLSYLFGLKEGGPYKGLVVGIVIGLFGILFDIFLKKVEPLTVFKGMIGLALGLLFARLILLPVLDMNLVQATESRYLSLGLSLLFGYLGIILTLKMAIPIPSGMGLEHLEGDNVGTIYVLDTSVIIDGRIADVCEPGFIEGVFIVPHFILQELQYIADSSDSLKREKGRRGLEVLRRMQHMDNLTVKVVSRDFPKIREVDAKLVALAKEIGGKIITKDFNLNKVAELQGVLVLNITELASALKPAILPGESMNVFILKEGKEMNQGVAYLEDGTMVVVENGRRYIGKNIEVIMSSVLQTAAGRMAFAKTRDSVAREELKIVKNA
jgi:uncharacterized protein YacL